VPSDCIGAKTLGGLEHVNADLFARAVQLVLAPVVMISSAAVILNGLLAHYGEVNGRIRTMNRERFDLVRTLAAADDQLCVERLAEIDHQLPDLLHRHRLIHDGILALYYAIVVLVLSMFAVAAAALSDIPWLSLGVLALLLVGTLVLLYGVLLTTLEIRVGRRSIVYESEQSLQLRVPARLDGGHTGAEGA
jgi:small-conductance mechanosensitive channel